MGRRSRAGDEALGLLALGVFACGAPVAFGYYQPSWALAALASLIAIVAVFFSISARPGSIAEHAQRHSALWGGASVFFASLLVLGVILGSNDRGTTAKAATARAREQADQTRREEEREIAERVARDRAAEVERGRVAAERAAEAQRTPQDRAAIATAALDEAGDLQDRVCRARRALSPIRQNQRSIPEVRTVMRRLRGAERDALREARDNARDGRMVLCCDGTASPSCECDRSNRRGCCSWHHGICGCEPLPAEITCSEPR